MPRSEQTPDVPCLNACDGLEEGNRNGREIERRAEQLRLSSDVLGVELTVRWSCGCGSLGANDYRCLNSPPCVGVSRTIASVTASMAIARSGCGERSYRTLVNLRVGSCSMSLG